jgi:hypothetical protein
MTRQQASRRRSIDPLHVLGIVLWLIGAAVVAGTFVGALAFLFSLAQYIPTLP